MRRCLRCGTEMVEDLAAVLASGSLELTLVTREFFRTRIAKLKYAVCPKCGYVETYIDDLSKFSQK